MILSPNTRYPRFSDALALVTLEGPHSPVTIGNDLGVKYQYSHKKPEKEFKHFSPYTKTITQQVSKHDERMMRNSRLPEDQVQKVIASSIKSREPHKKLPPIAKNLPFDKSGEVGRGWTDDELSLLRSVLEGADWKKEMDASLIIGNLRGEAERRLREELNSERTGAEVVQMLRLIRMYQQVQLLDSVHLFDSEQPHRQTDWVALFQIDETAATESIQVGARERPEIDEENPDESLILKQQVPSENLGEIFFSDASLEVGTYEFRYYMKGSTTAVCVSAPFSTKLPRCMVTIPSQTVVCGDAMTVAYSIECSRSHSPKDWIGIYQLNGYGPLGCVMRLQVPEDNKGEVQLKSSPIFPGTYEAKYHLGQHGDIVVGTSVQFSVQIRHIHTDVEAREVRIYLCSTVTDMVDERRAMVDQVIPKLQAKFEARFLTVTLVAMSWGLRLSGMHDKATEEETATLADLRIALEEIERSRPFFIALLGERYGWIPDNYDPDFLDNYPWLRSHRNDNILLPGVRASNLEIQILNGFLVQPSAAKSNAFFFRDSDYVRRSGIPVPSRGKYEPVSEYGREAVNQLKEEIRKIPSARVNTYQRTEALVEKVLVHLETEISAHFPASQHISRHVRINLITDRIHSTITKHQLEHHPTFDNVPLYAEVLFTSDVPVYLIAGPGGAKSSLIATALKHHFGELRQDPSVKWTGTPPEMGNGASGCCFTKGDQLHVFLVQYVGLEMTVTTEGEIIEHAMNFTKECLGLKMQVPWDADKLANVLPDWLEELGQHCIFTWVIDGIDQLMGLSPIETVGIHGKDDKVSKRHAGDVMEALEEREKNKIIAARTAGQQSIRRWLVPLLDHKDPLYAPKRFPNLRITVSGNANNSEDWRPIDAHLLDLISGTRGSLRTVELPVWPVEQRKQYVSERLQMSQHLMTPSNLEVAQDFLFLEVKPNTGDQDGASTKDNFNNGLYMHLCVSDVIEFCSGQRAEAEIRERFKILRTCDSLDKLCLRLLRFRAENQAVEAVLKYLNIVRLGLREGELLSLVRQTRDVTGEEFVKVIQEIEPFTIRLYGMIQLFAPLKRAVAHMFSGADNRAEFMFNAMELFSSMDNPDRKAQELPLLLLRLGKLDTLMEYITTQEALAFVGKRNFLRYVKAAHWPHEAIAMTLRKNFETAFKMEVPHGRKYEISKLQDGKSGTHALHPVLRPPELKLDPEMLPSARRAALLKQQVELFSQKALDIVDILSHLDSSTFEIAEQLLESLLKMLYNADAIAAIVDRTTSYPLEVFKTLQAFINLFECATSAMGLEAESPSVRQENARQNQHKAMQELISLKCKLMLQALEKLSLAGLDESHKGIQGESMELENRMKELLASFRNHFEEEAPKSARKKRGSTVDYL